MPISLWVPLLPILLASTPLAWDHGALDPQAASAGSAVAVTADPGSDQFRSTGFAWQRPVAGRVVRPFERPATRWSRGHRGVDLTARPGGPIRAAGPGIVTFAGAVAGRGVVSIEHAAGVRTTYEPVSPVVARGARVMGGQVIAILAPDHRHRDTVHWGLRVGADYIDPMRLFGRSPILKPLDIP